MCVCVGGDEASCTARWQGSVDVDASQGRVPTRWPTHKHLHVHIPCAVRDELLWSPCSHSEVRADTLPCLRGTPTSDHLPLRHRTVQSAPQTTTNCTSAQSLHTLSSSYTVMGLGLYHTSKTSLPASLILSPCLRPSYSYSSSVSIVCPLLLLPFASVAAKFKPSSATRSDTVATVFYDTLRPWNASDVFCRRREGRGEGRGREGKSAGEISQRLADVNINHRMTAAAAVERWLHVTSTLRGLLPTGYALSVCLSVTFTAQSLSTASHMSLSTLCLKKTSPMFLAITRDSIVGFS